MERKVLRLFRIFHHGRVTSEETLFLSEFRFILMNEHSPKTALYVLCNVCCSRQNKARHSDCLTETF